MRQTIYDKEHWSKLLSSSPRASFLQSWQWGEFQQSLGREVRRLSWGDEVIVQAIKMPLPLGKSYRYIPRGPIVIGRADDVSEAVLDLDKIFAGDGLFLRVDPVAEEPSPHPLPSRERGYLKFIPSVQAQCVRILDIRKSADELLAAMHPKTRYNINLAQKKGVVAGPGNIDDFLRLNRATRLRDNFKPHLDYYYQKMAEVLSRDAITVSPPWRGGEKGWCGLRIWQAAYQNKILASAIIIYFGDTVTYVHGASSDEHREVMAPHLLHWEIIKDAQERGFDYYDLGGVNPLDKSHPAYKKAWEGISRFKAGFGGETVCYPESFDLIYQPWWYRVYKIGIRVKRLTG